MSEANTQEFVFEKAYELKEPSRLSTGCCKIDEFLGGGLSVEGITEICGESGSGKSQFCIQLALTVQYPFSVGGLDGGVIYICSEEHFQSKRLYQMISSFPKRFHPNFEKKIEFGNNIYILHVSESKDLEESFEKISFLVKTKNIKLLILDSVTALFRGSSTHPGGRQKARDLRLIAKNFYSLCEEFGVLVVCVNQVTDCLSNNRGPVPALGLAWANLVTTRIQLKKINNLRKMEVVFAPDIPKDVIMYEITQSGVIGS